MKKKVFWIIYYAVALTMLCVALILFRDYITFTWYSAFPIGYSAIMLFLIWFYPNKYDKVLWNYRKQMVWMPYENQHEDGHSGECDKLCSRMHCLLLPSELVFILFFDKVAKAISGIIIIGIAHLIAILYLLTVVRRKIDREEEKMKQAQEEKEFLGKWK